MTFIMACYKEITIGKSTFKRYSSIALDQLKKVLPNVNMEEVWAKYGPRHAQDGAGK